MIYTGRSSIKRVKQKEMALEKWYIIKITPLLGEEKSLNAFKMSQRIVNQLTRDRRVQ